MNMRCIKWMVTGWFLLGISCGHKAPPPGKPDTTPPEVHLLHPPEGFGVRSGDTVGIVFEATDSSEVVRAVVKVNNQVVAADSAPPLELLWIVDTTRFHPSSETLILYPCRGGSTALSAGQEETS